MIGYLRGSVLEHKEGRALIFVGEGEGSGVGYTVTLPQSEAYRLLSTENNKIGFFIYTHVREDALDLYGFRTNMEKELFNTLLTVNGIGPKGAMSILSKVEPQSLIQALLDKNQELLQSVPGIGKKTAERLVVELSDSIRKKADIFQAIFQTQEKGSSSAHLQKTNPRFPELALTHFRDAKEALVGLGYREQDVVAVLNRLLPQEKTPIVLENMIRKALSQLA